MFSQDLVKYVHQVSTLTGRLIIAVVPGTVDSQKHLVVVVLIPVEGQDPGAPALRVSTEEL